MQEAIGEWAASRRFRDSHRIQRANIPMASSNHHHFKWLCVGVRVCQDGPMHSGCLQAIHPVSHMSEWESRTEANKERAAV